MYSSLLTTLLVLALVLIACATTTSAAPMAVDKRGGYTGRLFAHHAHERVGPTPTGPASAVAPMTVTPAPVAWNSAAPTAAAQE
ncbi:uncharacterized protein TRAVEDRAFT_51191 [Trametes versicolor FP-101664 SS1]|uniref:uncharacterized protein n=1 Tax=Trametes versicolor (strain FP-101664) TaxID=717944 RepID=UPI0004622BC3|nr:uncharacterized protein TRAVEDRAFT_51191 [Trametes versicolor FP-101664 SS1]EIW55063.1 hypothetical protein TRAVEDRAFT_51191 [Trametes versicolor FP-101664 SS1]